MASADAKKIREMLLATEAPKVLDPKDLLSSGCVTLNLAVSGLARGAFLKGHYYWFVGDSDTGKTFLTMTCMAEAAKNKYFADHEFYYDDVEAGMLMDVPRMFGQKVNDRLRMVSSRTTTEFYARVKALIKAGRPFIYILDSENALTTAEERAKSEQKAKSVLGGGKEPGTYGMNKAKDHSSELRVLTNDLARTESIVIIISQTRANTGMDAMYNPTVTTGGYALKFYATCQLWTTKKGGITKTVKGKPRELGVLSRVRVRKNRITGRKRETVVPIYHSYGIDDLRACIDYLVLERHWKASGKEDDENKDSATIEAPEFGFTGTRDNLIQKIEEEGLELRLRSLVGEVWGAIEEALKLKRKPRYS
jgi:RecA/RadA recombinase